MRPHAPIIIDGFQLRHIVGDDLGGAELPLHKACHQCILVNEATIAELISG